ncbi:MAG: hypothetical protein CW716_04815 [Candidatus Bathyarchaeum sp.]|nr:MAG: hypothetical protein CW716_04815 [Candidatus Bathyarchaeum sp.]
MPTIVRAVLLFILVNSFLFGVTAVSAEAPGVIVIIGSDTTWTKADSPHELTGPILVNQGVTLTVEAGATVNLNGYELRVNGTLRAKGTSTNYIVLDDGTITFTEFSNPWDEQTGTGSIIQFAILNDVQIGNSVPVSINENPVGEDNVWTKEESPINFTGSITVDETEILTVEAGVTVNMQGHDLIVKGTLQVFGDSSNKVHFYGGLSTAKINFTETSTTWDEQTATGSIIDHAIIDRVNLIIDSSPKISNCNTTFKIFAGGSCVLMGNTISVLSITGGSVVASNNDIEIINECHGTPEILNNTIKMIYGPGGSPVISGNTITELGVVAPGENTEIHWLTADSPTISNNIIQRGMYLKAESSIISGNTITGYTYTYSYDNFEMVGMFPVLKTYDGAILTSGITLLGSGHVEGNTIFGCNKGIEGGTTVVRNVLVGNDVGVFVNSFAVIQNNTFKDNRVAIAVHPQASKVTISYNNFENSTQNSIYLVGVSSNIDATNNWWGTSDLQAINLTIHDYKYEFGLGKVNFTPFLTEPNTEAVPNEIPEFPAWAVLPLFLVATFGVIIVRKKLGSYSK